jgi:hypothetical protein
MAAIICFNNVTDQTGAMGGRIPVPTGGKATTTILTTLKL